MKQEHAKRCPTTLLIKVPKDPTNELRTEYEIFLKLFKELSREVTVEFCVQ